MNDFHVEKMSLTSEHIEALDKVLDIFERYDSIEQALKKLPRETAYDYIVETIGRPNFPRNPLLLIENIPSREHHALLHFALSSTFRDSRVEKYLIINEENSFLEQQGLHQDSSGGFVSFFCEEGGGIVPTVFINHTDLRACPETNAQV